VGRKKIPKNLVWAPKEQILGIEQNIHFLKGQSEKWG